MSNMLIQLLPIIVVFVVFYFVLLVPEKKRKKNYNTMLSELKVNDDIMTRGGIIGRIVSLDDEYMVIETSSDRTKIKFSRNAVANKIYKENEK